MSNRNALFVVPLCMALMFCVGRYMPHGTDSAPVQPVITDYEAGENAAKALLNGYADVLDGVGSDVESGETDAAKLYKRMADDTKAARKTAMEPLEAQLDKSAPPDKLTKASAKPFRDAAKAFRERAK